MVKIWQSYSQNGRGVWFIDSPFSEMYVIALLFTDKFVTCCYSFAFSVFLSAPLPIWSKCYCTNFLCLQCTDICCFMMIVIRSRCARNAQLKFLIVTVINYRSWNWVLFFRCGLNQSLLLFVEIWQVTSCQVFN